MNTLEDRVRQALREAAEDISRTDVPLLRLPDRAGRGRLARGWRGWPPWLTPLAAAAAVAAVLAATLTLTGGPDQSSPHRTGQDGLLASAPRYYVTVANTGRSRGWPRQAEVRATRTGRIVATLAAPRPDNAFIMVAAASGAGRYVSPHRLRMDLSAAPNSPSTKIPMMKITIMIAVAPCRSDSDWSLLSSSPSVGWLKTSTISSPAIKLRQAKHQALARGQIAKHLGEQILNHLERSDRPAKLQSLLGVFEGSFERAHLDAG